MVEVINCPSCGRKLRVPGKMRGRLVKCPGCFTTFLAGQGAVEAPPDGPVEKGPQQAGETEPFRNEPPPEEGAFREATGQPPADRAPNVSPKGQVACPYCGESNPAEALRCRWCDEELEEEARPWERRGEVRRDCEPHRGGLVLTLGIISVSLTPLTLLTACCLFVGGPAMIASLALGITSWVMGQGDLRKMDKGIMDPEGRGKTHAGMVCGIIGTAAACFCGLGEGALLAFQLSLR